MEHVKDFNIVNVSIIMNLLFSQSSRRVSKVTILSAMLRCICEQLSINVHILQSPHKRLQEHTLVRDALEVYASRSCINVSILQRAQERLPERTLVHDATEYMRGARASISVLPYCLFQCPVYPLAESSEASLDSPYLHSAERCAAPR